VAFGVLLALGLSEWRGAVKDRALAEQALRGIANELEANRTSLEQRRLYYGEMAKTLEGLARAAQPGDGMGPIPGWRGIMPPLLRASAYDAAIATGAFAQLDFVMASRVAGAYALQRVLEQLFATYTNALVAGSIDDYRRLGGLFHDLHGVSGEVVMGYSQALEVLPKSSAVPGAAVGP
jgi:hypothetical protein